MFKELRALSVFDWMDDSKWENACTKHEQHLVPLLDPLFQILQIKFRKGLVTSTKSLVLYGLEDEFMPRLRHHGKVDKLDQSYITLFEEILKLKRLLNDDKLRTSLHLELQELAHTVRVKLLDFS